MPEGDDVPVGEGDLVEVADGVLVLERLAEGVPEGVDEDELECDAVELDEGLAVPEELSLADVDMSDDEVCDGDDDKVLEADEVCEAVLHTASAKGPQVAFTPHAQNVQVVQADAPLEAE